MPVHGGGGPGGFGLGGPGSHGSGPGDGGGHGRGGPHSRSGGIFSGMAHVGFGGQGIFGHFFGTRATANTGVTYESRGDKYYYQMLEELAMKDKSQSTSDPSKLYPNFMLDSTIYFTSHSLAFLSVIYASMSVFANILAAQVWHLGPLQLDAGILVYPFTYVTLDVITEIYHKNIANRVVNWTCALNVICMIALVICRFLPSVDGVENVNLATALNFSAVIFIASIVATWFGGHVNNFIYEKLRPRTKPGAINSRSWISSMFGRPIDSFVFSAIAFLFRMPFLTFLRQFFFSFLAAVIIETVLYILGVKGLIANSIKRQIGIQDESTRTNP